MGGGSHARYPGLDRGELSSEGANRGRSADNYLSGMRYLSYTRYIDSRNIYPVESTIVNGSGRVGGHA